MPKRHKKSEAVREHERAKLVARVDADWKQHESAESLRSIARTMDNYTATGIAEGFIECDDEQRVFAAWQRLHDTGLAYQLQGWFGRRARDLIAAGLIHE